MQEDTYGPELADSEEQLFRFGQSSAAAPRHPPDVRQDPNERNRLQSYKKSAGSSVARIFDRAQRALQVIFFPKTDARVLLEAITDLSWLLLRVRIGLSCDAIHFTALLNEAHYVCILRRLTFPVAT